MRVWSGKSTGILVFPKEPELRGAGICRAAWSLPGLEMLRHLAMTAIANSAPWNFGSSNGGYGPLLTA